MSGDAGRLGGLVHVRRGARGHADGALVLFHGRGADEHDLHPLLDMLDHGRRLVGETPRAPLELPPGGAHWYVVARVGYPDPATFAQGYAAASGFVDELAAELEIGHDRIVVGGFSQGAVMASSVALGAGRPRVAGLVMLSGFIPVVEGWEPDPSNIRGLPTVVSHGSEDPVIGVEFGRAAAEQLEAGGAALTWREQPVGHTIDPAIIPDLRVLVAEAVPARDQG